MFCFCSAEFIYFLWNAVLHLNMFIVIHPTFLNVLYTIAFCWIYLTIVLSAIEVQNLLVHPAVHVIYLFYFGTQEMCFRFVSCDYNTIIWTLTIFVISPATGIRIILLFITTLHDQNQHPYICLPVEKWKGFSSGEGGTLKS